MTVLGSVFFFPIHILSNIPFELNYIVYENRWFSFLMIGLYNKMFKVDQLYCFPLFYIPSEILSKSRMLVTNMNVEWYMTEFKR